MTAATVSRICYFNNPTVAGHFRGYEIGTLNPAAYFIGTGRCGGAVHTRSSSSW